MQAGGEEEDDPELTTLLAQALSSPSDSNSAQALGQVFQARLTEASAVPSLVARLWHTFFAAATADDDMKKKEAKSEVLQGRVRHSAVHFRGGWKEVEKCARRREGRWL